MSCSKIIVVVALLSLLLWGETGFAADGKIAGLGRLMPSTDVIDIMGLGGDRVDRLDVKEGSQVEQGTVLAWLSSYPARQAEKDLAEQKLKAAEAHLDLDVSAQQHHLSRLRGELTLARMELKQFVAAHVTIDGFDPDRPNALENLMQTDISRQPEHIQAQLELDAALAEQKWQVNIQRTRMAGLQQEFKLAQERLDDIKTSKAEEYASPATISEREQEALKARNRLDIATLELEKLRRSLKVSVDRARVRLRNAIPTTMNQRISRYLQAKDAVTQAATELERRRRLLQSEVLNAQENLRIAGHHLYHGAIRSPVSGTVLKMLAKPGDVTGRTVLFKLGNIDTMYAVAEIYESDALRLKVNQKATIASVALPNKIAGKVESIGAMIFKNTVSSLDPSALTNSRVVEVWIRLEPNPFARKLVYLQVDVVIHE